MFVLFLLGCFEGKANNIEKNYVEKPPGNFSGTWIVYNKVSNKQWIEAEYADGKKNGTEFRWNPYSGNKMSKHTFRMGVLEGPYVKWDDYDGDIRVEGEYKNGQPWNGAFLEDWEFNIDYSLDVVDRDLLYSVRDYVDGELMLRRQIP